MEIPPGDCVLRVSGLTKSYKVGFLARGSKPALVDLSFEVRRGEIFGYLGPNGSGKTTTIKILMGLVFADSGSVAVLGATLSDSSWRGRVGYLPEHPYFYDYLTPAEYLDYAGRLSGLPAGMRRDRAGRLLDLVGLSAVATTPLRRFSKGMLQRVGIAQALVGDPEMVVLDEPMSGLDPIGRRLVRDIILGLRKEGRTVFFSTHILSDAETLCDRVALLRAGRLVKAGRLDEILAADETHDVEILASGGGQGALATLPGGALCRERMGERSRIVAPEASLVPVLDAITRAGARVLSVQPIRLSLDDYFMKEMGPVPEGPEWPLTD